MTDGRVRAHAPGRVNLIGEHTDYTGGMALPMAIDLGTTVVGERTGERVVLRSDAADDPAIVDLADGEGRPGDESGWARYVAAVVEEVRPSTGLVGHVRTTLPVGGGLGSSAALEVAIALALGFGGDRRSLARRCQAAEHRAVGVPCGVMDQLASAAGVDGHALLVNCSSLAVTPVPLPDGVEVVVVDSGEPRALAESGYAERRAQVEAVEGQIGPLRQATLDDVEAVRDPLLRRRARHVVTENQRVRDVVDALRADDLAAAGRLLDQSHASLRDDYEVSTPTLDGLCRRLRATEGVLGARLVGAGFGGSVVALAEPGSPVEGRRVRASTGATVEPLS